MTTDEILQLAQSMSMGQPTESDRRAVVELLHELVRRRKAAGE